MIRCDNGPEYVSDTLLQWAADMQIRIEYIQPGKPQQNPYVERYKHTVSYAGLRNTSILGGLHHEYSRVRERSAAPGRA